MINLLADNTRSLIDDGHLCDASYFVPARSLGVVDLCMITEYQRICSGKRTIVYCTSIAHAEHVAEQFNNAGIPASAFTAQQSAPERKAIISNYKARQLLVLTACNALDDKAFPETEAIVLASPTRSPGLHTMRIASALRAIYAEGMPTETSEQRRAAIAASSKPRAIVIDLADNIQRLGVLPY